MIYIGIDPGTETGFAVWNSNEQRFVELGTLKIHQAIQSVVMYHEMSNHNCKVIFEDARQRKWYGQRSDAKLQGAGSVKRDSSIWEDFLKDWGIPYWAKPPVKGATKMSNQRFKALTGWKGRTSNHARDAALLVWGK